MRTIIVIAAAAAVWAGTLYAQNSEQSPPTPSAEQPEVLTRGPVHEAFAEPVDLQNQSGVVAPNGPPPNIVETIPDDKPMGNQYVWVPGYWAWDSDRGSYIWVSGCWRAAPPDRYWMPGYWYQTAQGWEWVAGFWAPLSDAEQLQYLPTPPPIGNVEAPGPPTVEGSVWIPPCWYWTDNGYVLRPGYWLEPQQGWLWSPSHYIWTPRGYLFDTGHWDYSLDRRGVLFTPYYIPRAVYERPNFSLSLGVAVDLGLLELNLFTYPRYCHYYFGDYYDEMFVSIGIFPQFYCNRLHTWYDPIYVHNRWRHHETSLVWDAHQQQYYDARRADGALRPPRTYSDMEDRMAKLPESQWKDFRMVEPFRRVVSNVKGPMKFKPVRANEKQSLLRKATGVRQFREYRNNMETPPVEQRGLGLHHAQGVHNPAPSAEEHRTAPAAQAEHGRTETHRAESPASSEQRGGFANRQARITEPQRVNIPSPTISHKQGFFEKGPPSRPSNERRTEGSRGHGRRGK